MDDFWGFIAVLLLALPIALIVMLSMLLSRQRQAREEVAAALANIERRLRAQQGLLERLNAQPPQAAVAAEQAPAAAETAAEPPPPPEPAPVAVSEMAEPVSAPAAPAIRVEQPAADPWQTADWQPAEPSRFELAAQKILKEIWNWIIVGEGHRPEGAAMEYAVASNWLLRIGVLILVTGIGFFLKYSIDNGLIGEQARVALTLLAGVGMVAGGVRLVGGQYHLFGQGLLGGGIAVLYFGVFAAFAFYHLLGVYPTFALMVLVTASAAFLAVRLNSMLVALFAIVGGYCTPLLLSTGQVNFVGLFSYMLLLGGGLLAINGYKHWHLLNFLSFVCNYLLFFGAMQKYQTEYFWQVLPFLVGFFVLYSTMVFLFCLVNRSKSTLLDLIALLANAAIFFATAYQLIDEAYGQIWTALLAVALAAFYVGHAYYCLARKIADRELLVSFIGLAAFFLSVTLPLLLSAPWLTASWSLQALAMAWMAGKVNSAFLRQAAYLLYLLVIVRFCFVDLPGQYAAASDYGASLGGFLFGLLQRLAGFGIPIASLALAYRLIEQPAAASALACTPETDTPLWIKDRWLLQAIAVAGAGLLFVALQLELYRSFAYLYPPLQLPMLSLVWLALCWLLLQRFLAGSGAWLLTALQWFLVGVAVKLVFFDLPSWDLALGAIGGGDDLFTLRYAGAYRFESALMRLFDFAAIIAFLLFALNRLAAGAADTGRLRQWLGGSALALLFTFSSLEINSILYQYVPGLRSGGVTILWSIFALALVFNGIKRRIPALRLVGLGLFALVAWKVFFVDLARLEQIYRIVAFIVLGMLALGGAFFYMRYQQNFIGNDTAEKSP
ncbi:DUF2339 domain-containing protein [Methylomonas sp. DH-1]|uniref:DUF2339 domain-containing protein n=1 Tax=Methylomonas sp. (strain DH-1) TaxID=1727196 RepID=UPI0007C89411|nr:DUF2339 domain-containing protein [Methylomonas sp. DH-1]ANE54840.1 hypothetical protein AYM39_06370 [Methylomonas sp. DH-1]